MNKFDSIILGAGTMGRRVAIGLAEKKQKVLVVSLPDKPETKIRDLAQALSPFSNHMPAETMDTVSSYEEVSGPFKFISSNEIQINSETYKAKKFVLAMGALDAIPELSGAAACPLFTAQQILRQELSPKSVIIIGSGSTSVALAQIFKSQGAGVQVVSNHNRLLPHVDETMAERIQTHLQNQGVEIWFQSFPHAVAKENNGLKRLTFESPQGEKSISAEAIVLATGFKPNLSHMDIEKSGVYINDHGFVVTNDEMRSSQPHIWALGPLTPHHHSLMLEEHQTDMIINNMTAPFFAKIRLESGAIPHHHQITPPLAYLGLSEEAARQEHSDIITHVQEFPQKEGIIKLVGRRKHQNILGVWIWGPHAAEMILFFDLVMRAEIPLMELEEQHHYLKHTWGETLLRTIKTWNENN